MNQRNGTCNSDSARNEAIAEGRRKGCAHRRQCRQRSVAVADRPVRSLSPTLTVLVLAVACCIAVSSGSANPARNCNLIMCSTDFLIPLHTVTRLRSVASTRRHTSRPSSLPPASKRLASRHHQPCCPSTFTRTCYTFSC